MKIKYIKYLLIISVITIITLSCGEKFDLNNINVDDENVNIGGDTLYIQLNPIWTGYNKPQDVMVGREPFIYVADTDNDRVVMLNLDGQILGTRSIKKPIALAQDYRLNIIVCAQFDTTLNAVTQTFSAVYKLDMVSVDHQINIAPIRRLLPRGIDLNRPDVEYTGTCAFFTNVFYVSRKGPNNTSFVDPDNSILIFAPIPSTNRDTLIGRVPNIDPLGQGPVSAYNISSITSYNNQSIDMVLTLVGGTSFKSQAWQYVVTPLDQRYLSNFSPSSGIDFMIPNRFERPEGSALDNSGNIFIADAGKDSIYKFSPFGDELQSFGGPDVFNEPYGVAFFNKTLYVADKENNRIMRYILSTDQ